MFHWQKLAKEHNHLQKQLLKVSPDSSCINTKLELKKNYITIFENELFKLNCYINEQCTSNHIALCVYSLVNQVTILDFSREISFISSLNLLYQKVYVIEWKLLTEQTMNYRLEQYCIASISLAVDESIMDANTTSVDLFGVCQGGVFSLVYSAIFPKKINRLVLLMTPVDHQKLYYQSQLIAFYKLQVLPELKILTKEVVKNYFASLRPLKHYLGRYIDIACSSSLKRKKLLAIDNWLDQPMPLAINVFNEYYKKIIQKNQLIEGNLTLAEHQVNLMNINFPVINVCAVYDQLVPIESTKSLSSVVSSPYDEIILNTGHIGIFTQKRYLNQFIRQFKRLID
ncbi:alpha/beta fold hydrolase [Thiotrichales bacterium 19S3-7]|nr:alpha/beta fold hydrolase [Thiotrichales bacterium 19S3-7]MCF6802351.1 alpha/beta fold hydrolase [Thiotrichales bacterium 19S3-11]